MRCVRCEDCQNFLGNTEIALNLKLCGRAASRFFCLPCLSRRLDCAESTLREMAAFYRGNGCELFVRDYIGKQEEGEAL